MRLMMKRSRTKPLGFEGHSKGIEESPEAALQTVQMCLIHNDFKHLLHRKAKHFRLVRKVSSIMPAKVLSIMPAGDAGLTRLFKRFRTRLGYGLTHRPGT